MPSTRRTLRLAGLVLAGGRSQRMGRPKALLPWGGRTVLEQVVANLARACSPVAVLARDQGQDLPELLPEAALWFDRAPDRGPLTAIADGLARLRGQADAVAVCGCDQPFFDADAIAWLASQLDGADAVVPRLDGYLNPLAAVYRTDTAETLAALTTSGAARAQRIAELPRIRIVDDFGPLLHGARFVLGLNTPDEYRRALGLAGMPPEPPSAP